ncbi:PilT1: twitching mobility protein [Desulfosarcina variabilis str. Montpellier]|uniref:type IV pilus twitching motility protein PilT n=1 Tax=Desulfosarcina variabilis TaxID=2300 RepID=UPI003AFB540F
MAFLDKVFQAAVNVNASDIHVCPGEPFIVRRYGQLVKMKSTPLTMDQTRQLILEVLTKDQQDQLLTGHQLDFAIDREQVGRFRGSAMRHNRGFSAVFRRIPPDIPDLESLGLPPVAKTMLDNHQGLILVTGATGQGKSTTLAAMIDYLNTHRAHHILTVEDPIEFVHPIKKGIVNQRQLGKDTWSYANALKAALREDPDVIMIGELRDLETMSLAISAAETGHLVIGTLATSSGPKTVDRIIDAFPPEEQNQIRAMLSESLRAVITQRLIPGADNEGMQMAVEVLVGTLPMANLIRDGKTYQIPSMMQTAKNVGMQIMDDAILQLLQEKKINARSAQRHANDPKRFQAFVDKADKETD